MEDAHWGLGEVVIMSLGKSIVFSGDTMLQSFTLAGDEVRERILTEPHVSSICSESSCSVSDTTSVRGSTYYGPFL